MTEELKQKAKEWLKEKIKEKSFGHFPIDCLEAYIAGATETTKELQEENKRLTKHILELQRDKGRLADENKRISIQYAEETDETIKELEKQIEKMKCCGNCIYRGECDLSGYKECKNFDKWELAE